ncbi:uncharacterized protein LOC62_04G005284 [Vanrija pseudolonga]|uniref:Uncharacterized protein n=1 Tax=Vanrija pseudolonga TaxID=143232 RepID=A0AAF1BR63_9TREE|nr:hypothetical protein LOC62_04G005284 [Vanrija pseudolonga]
MPTALDYKGYPHIMALIVSFAPWSARLSLRATCRALRDDITRDLMTHVALYTTLDEKCPRPTWDEMAEDDDGRRWEDYTEIASVPAYPGEEVHLLPFSPGYVHTIDHGERVYVGVDAVHNCMVLSKLFPNRRTVRVLQTFEPGYAAENLVFFITLPVVDNMPWGIAESRLVLHVVWDEATLTGDNKKWLDLSFPGNIARTDLVLWGSNPRETPQDVLYLLHICAADLLRMTAADGVMTVVGADALSCDRVEEQFKAGAKARLANENIPTQERIEGIRFVTREAWLEELGEDRQALGCWPVA